jgi:hypothetical protein
MYSVQQEYGILEVCKYYTVLTCDITDKGKVVSVLY